MVTKITHMHEMNSVTPSVHSIATRIDRIYAKISELLSPLTLLALRLPVAVVFWRSGRTRVAGGVTRSLGAPRPQRAVDRPPPALGYRSDVVSG